ncbi:hypothetical protein [Spirosoma pomorum]
MAIGNTPIEGPIDSTLIEGQIDANLPDNKERLNTAGTTRALLKILVRWLASVANSVLQANTFFPAFEWNGTKLRLKNPDNSWAPEVDLKATLAPESVLPGMLSKLTYERTAPFTLLNGDNKGQVFNGAVFLMRGITIPVGRTGETTFFLKAYPLAGVPVGRKMTLYIDLTSSDAAGIDLVRWQANGRTAPFSQEANVATNLTTEAMGEGRWRIRMEYTVQAGHSSIEPFFQVTNQVARTVDTTIEATFYIIQTDSFTNPATLEFERVRNTLTEQQADIDDKTLCFSVATAPEYIPLAGAVLDGSTIRIPVGKTGNLSYIVYNLQAAQLDNWQVNNTIHMMAIVALSPDLADEIRMNCGITRNGQDVDYQAQTTGMELIAPGILALSFSYTIQTGDTAIKPFVQLYDNRQATEVELTFRIVDLCYAPITPAGMGSSQYVFRREIRRLDERANTLQGQINALPFQGQINNLQSQLIGQQSQINSQTLSFTLKPILTNYITFNGAVQSGKALQIPIGQTGRDSYIQPLFNKFQFVNWSVLVGKAVQFTMVAQVDAGIRPHLNCGLNVQRGSQELQGQAANVQKAETNGLMVFSFTYTIQAGDSDLMPFLQIGGGIPAATVLQSFSILKTIYTPIVPTGYQQNEYVLEQELQHRDAQISALKGQVGYFPSPLSITTLTVKADGTGDFTSVKLANDSIVDSSPNHWYEILFHPAINTEVEYHIKPYTIVRGTLRDACILAGEMPDWATDDQISLSSTIWVDATSELYNLTITCRNMRYPVHSEAGGNNVDARHHVQNCTIHHFGNQGARAWRQAHPESGMSPLTVWTSENPWGYGSGSGVDETFEDVTFIGPGTGWYIHDNKDFTRGTVNKLRNCRLVKTGGWGSVIVVQPLGSGVTSTIDLRGCSITPGYIVLDDNPWLTKRPENQVADHCQYNITLSDCSNIGFLDNTRGRALRINSTGTSVRVSGSAVPLIFGTVTTHDGGGGLGGYLYGSWDISGIPVGFDNEAIVNTLGRRLGNCTSATKTLNCLFQDGTSKVITFNQDYTAQSNATILALINGVLGAAGAAFEHNVTEGEHYPEIQDKQVTLLNSTGTGIPRWSAVCYDTSINTVRLMTAADDAALFLGIAIERIVPGNFGRVLTEGYMHRTQLAGFGSNIVIGQSISQTGNGQFEISGTKVVARGIALDWAHFKGNR